MGNCFEKETPEQAAAKKRHRAANSIISKVHDEQAGQVTILFLGTAETGKSTMTRMFRIVSTLAFTDDERIVYRGLIRRGVVQAIKLIIKLAQDEGIKIEREGFADHIQHIDIDEADEVYDAPLAISIHQVWEQEELKALLQVASAKGCSVDWVPYLLDHCQRFGSEEFIPEDRDILRTRVVTTGIKETSLYEAGKKWKLLDVGGQRIERKKWAYCFEGVTSVIYFAALSDYDLPLAEDATVNRLDESLSVFYRTINNIWFEKKPIILFLNKKDLFEKKIETVPLTVWRKDYEGDNSYNSTLGYIRKQFKSKNRNSNRNIYVHDTCALDANNIAKVFINVEVILQELVLDQIQVF